MSHESHGFAPTVIHTEDRTKSPDGIVLPESLEAKKERALYVYRMASANMCQRDEEVDKENLARGNDGLTPSFNKNAITAASLLMVAALRAAEIS